MVIPFMLCHLLTLLAVCSRAILVSGYPKSTQRFWQKVDSITLLWWNLTYAYQVNFAIT